MAYENIFCDLIETPLDLKRAKIEASRCYYCYDAPCVQACPTQIDIPSFIRKISNENVKGAALDILSANIMGGTCARACPVEILCQKACVREKSEQKPVTIGLLQRFATDEYFKTGDQCFQRALSNEITSGIKIAIVGAGPAGLSCAHALARLGYEITLFEAKEKLGGLNEFGLAPYKLTQGFAQKEIEFILSIGGIKIQTGKRLGQEITLTGLKKQFAAVFLGVGLERGNRLGIPGEDLPGFEDAIQKISSIRQAQDVRKISVSKNIVVIGGGNTSIDIAIQMKKLGADCVTIVYRRDRKSMSATLPEQELAQMNGVVILEWLKPVKYDGVELQLEATKLVDGKISGTGKFTSLKAESVFRAIGQGFNSSIFEAGEVEILIHNGKVKVDENFETPMPGIFAGGDCTGVGEALTVTAVQHGKLAAQAIHRKIKGEKNG